MQETFIVGGREFTVHRMNPWDANTVLMRLQKIIVPVIGSLAGNGKNLMDVDLKDAAQVIAMHLDESIMDTIVFPLFSGSKLFCVENKKFIKSGMDINQCFTTENLFDMYELIWLVGRYQLGPFLHQMMSRFGSLTGDNPMTKKSPAN